MTGLGVEHGEVETADASASEASTTAETSATEHVESAATDGSGGGLLAGLRRLLS